MAPKQKPVAEMGGVQRRNGKFRARVHACTGDQYCFTRSTEEEAVADLNAARNGAPDKEDVGRHLAALVAAASGLPATRRSESTLPSSSSAASASASAASRASTSAPAAEQRQPPLESCAAASAAKPAAEQRRPTLSDDAEVSGRLRSRAVAAGPLAVRIVDHASASSSAVSSRVAALCTSAGVHARADLSCDQPTDACGYIAADAVVRLRDAALAEAEGWLTAVLPDYANLAAVRRGEAALGRGGAERVLEVADVNALVRHYSHLEAHPQAHEEWWGGAVSLDNFLDGGLPEFLGSLAGGQQAQHQHRFRAWVVNTHSSWQRGSHWFTVVAGPRLGAAEPSPSRPAAEQSHGGAEPSPSRPAVQQSQARGDALDGAHDPNDYPALFPNPSAALVQAMVLARASPDAGATGALKRACEEWNAALADGTYAARKKRRKLCTDHGIPCKRDMEKDAEAAARVARGELAQRLQALLQQKSLLERYFSRKPGAADILAAPEAVGSSVAMDVATAYAILRLKRAEHEADPDFRIAHYWLGRLRNCTTQAHCRALTGHRSKNPDVINGRVHFTYRGMTKSNYREKPANAAEMGKMY